MIQLRYKSLISIILLFFASCLSCTNTPGSKEQPSPKESRTEIERNSPNSPIAKIFNEKQVRLKIGQFSDALKKRGKKLTAADWKLHDELLDIYIHLKNQTFDGTLVRVPAKSRLKVNLQSFCLDSGRASPDKNERFKWLKKAPSIPYYKDILRLASNKSITAENAQSLLWNLQNKAPWESYPDHLQAILQKIDPKAALKLPSRAKDQIKSAALEYLRDSVPGVAKAENVIGITEGEYYKYADYSRSIEQLKSQFQLEISDVLLNIPDTKLYSDVNSNGYTNQSLTFYNPTNIDQEIDLADYYLQPQRQDVQRIGLAGKEPQEQSLISELEYVLFDSMLRVGVGFTPILGDVADLFELLTGKDFLTNKDLDWNGRLLSGVGLIVGSGQAYRLGQRALNAPERFLVDFEKGVSHASGKEVHLTYKSLKQSEQVLSEANQLKKAMSSSPTLKNKMSAPKFNKADFYITPKNEVVPAKAFRYLPSDSPAVETIVKNGKIPNNNRGTYFSFHDFGSATAAKSGLQVPHDAAIKIEFDTLQIVNDIRIPRGKWGSADYLEPLTKDFPDFGTGGATQAVTSNSFKIFRVTNMKTDQVLYGQK